MATRPPAVRVAPRTPGMRFVAERPSAEVSILNAAVACFERAGVRGTTVEDIAAEARVSRATLYRYFSCKEAIVDRVSALETERVNNEMREALTADMSSEDTIVECLLLSTRIAHQSPRVRALVEDTYTASRAADPSSPQHQAYRASWGKLISKAFKNGIFAKDLKAAAVENWLTLSLITLLIKVDAVDIKDDELRAFIKRFIVRPLLA